VRTAGDAARIAWHSTVALTRDAQVVFWNFGFFTLLLVLSLGVLSRGDAAVQASLTVAIVTLAVMANALFSIGVGVASARDRGVFRRFATTPVPAPAAVLAVVGARAGIVFSAAAVQVLLARILFDIAWSGGAASVLAVLASGTAAFASIGLAIAALAPAPHVANAWANLVLLPMMVLGGTVLPVSMLPAPVAEISGLLPSGAMVQALSAALVGAGGVGDLLASHGVLLGWAATAAAIGTLRWEPAR
jgi:ABC-2 type transport system permease protein